MSHTHEIAWAAGFFDGEGYVNIQKRSHKKYIGFYLRIGINHVAIEPLLEMQKLFGGSVVQCNSYKNSGNRKIRHRWVTSTFRASAALKMMMPFFKNKNKVAAVALDFQNTISPNNRIAVSDEIQKFRIDCKNKIMILNALD